MFFYSRSLFCEFIAVGAYCRPIKRRAWIFPHDFLEAHNTFLLFFEIAVEANTVHERIPCKVFVCILEVWSSAYTQHFLKERKRFVDLCLLFCKIAIRRFFSGANLFDCPQACASERFQNIAYYRKTLATAEFLCGFRRTVCDKPGQRTLISRV